MSQISGIQRDPMVDPNRAFLTSLTTYDAAAALLLKWFDGDPVSFLVFLSTRMNYEEGKKKEEVQQVYVLDILMVHYCNVSFPGLHEILSRSQKICTLGWLQLSLKILEVSIRSRSLQTGKNTRTIGAPSADRLCTSVCESQLEFAPNWAQRCGNLSSHHSSPLCLPFLASQGMIVVRHISRVNFSWL